MAHCQFENRTVGQQPFNHYSLTHYLWAIAPLFVFWSKHTARFVLNWRVARIWKRGGAILKEWEVCKRPWLEFSLTLNQFQTVCPKFETKCLGKIGNSKFFPPKIRWSPKKKKKKRSSPKYRAIFLPISQVQKYEGELFSYGGGGYFPFFTENRPQQHKKHAILHTSQANGGDSSPPRPPPGYATGSERMFLSFKCLRRKISNRKVRKQNPFSHFFAVWVTFRLGGTAVGRLIFCVAIIVAKFPTFLRRNCDWVIRGFYKTRSLLSLWFE